MPLSPALGRALGLAIITEDPLAELWISMELCDHDSWGPPRPELSARLQDRLGTRSRVEAHLDQMAQTWLEERRIADYQLQRDGVLQRSPTPVQQGLSVQGIERLIKTISGISTDDVGVVLVEANRTILERIRTRLLRYLLQLESDLALRVATVSAIERSAQQAHQLISRRSPRVAEHLRHAEDALKGSGVDATAHSLLSLRRGLLALADTVYPAKTNATLCADGKTRDLGPDKYKNRIIEFVAVHAKSGSLKATVKAEIEHIAGRLESVYDQQNRGVHDEVGETEAVRVTTRTYLLIADVLELTDDEGDLDASV